MRVKSVIFVTLLVVPAVFAAPADQQAAGQEVSSAAESAAAFGRIIVVFRHPRCSNCHTVTDFPRQGDDRHRHAMNVRRGADGRGVAAQHCRACHQRANQVASGVPGADEDWRLAPLSIGWEGLSDSELCRHLLDPARNGGRSGEEVLDHLATNLVRWAWSPGVARSGGARSIPPVDYDSFIREARRWIDLGAACPAP
jgi:mono/diheme cytochrome c family protein